MKTIQELKEEVGKRSGSSIYAYAYRKLVVGEERIGN
jgi:hypothetical protein